MYHCKTCGRWSSTPNVKHETCCANHDVVRPVQRDIEWTCPKCGTENIDTYDEHSGKFLDPPVMCQNETCLHEPGNAWILEQPRTATATEITALKPTVETVRARAANYSVAVTRGFDLDDVLALLDHIDKLEDNQRLLLSQMRGHAKVLALRAEMLFGTADYVSRE